MSVASIYCVRAEAKAAIFEYNEVFYIAIAAIQASGTKPQNRHLKI
jgi:hypothetical protein